MENQRNALQSAVLFQVGVASRICIVSVICTRTPDAVKDWLALSVKAVLGGFVIKYATVYFTREENSAGFFFNQWNCGGNFSILLWPKVFYLRFFLPLFCVKLLWLYGLTWDILHSCFILTISKIFWKNMSQGKCRKISRYLAWLQRLTVQLWAGKASRKTFTDQSLGKKNDCGG